MSTKIETITDCTSGRDYLELAQRNEWPIRKNGSYWEIEADNGVMVRLPDCARALPKETRGLINVALIKAGLVVAVLASIVLAWVVW